MNGRQIEDLYEELFAGEGLEYDVFERKLCSCIEKLRRPHRKIIKSVYIDGKTFQQTANEYSISIQHVITIVKNSKKELKMLLLDDDEITLKSPVLRLTSKCSQSITSLTIKEFIDKINDGSIELSNGTDIVMKELLKNNFKIEVTEFGKFEKVYPANLFHDIYKETGYDLKDDKRYEILKFILETDVKKSIMNPTEFLLLQKRYKDKESYKVCALLFNRSQNWARTNCVKIQNKLKEEIEKRM